MKSFAIYGKGGSGKSMVACNLSVQLAQRGTKTLQIGCDPKRDSTRALMGGRRIATVVDVLQNGLNEKDGGPPPETFLFEGAGGVGCIETGGPESGAGCAGLGIVSAFRLIRKLGVFDRYEAVIMDVLGDVVCGGFAMPLTRGLAGAVVIVVSETIMSMYAANNIARAVLRHRRNGAVLAGLVANNVKRPGQLDEIHTFAGLLGSRVLADIPHAEQIFAAERNGRPVSLEEPGGDLSATFGGLADALWTLDPQECPPPTPLSDERWDGFLRSLGG